MSWVWYCIEISVNLVETGLLIFLINSKFENKTNSLFPGFVALVSGTAGLSCVGLCHITVVPDYSVLLTVIIVYSLLARRGKVWKKIFWSSIGIALICAIAVMGISLALLLPGITIDIILKEQSSTRFHVQIFCKLMQAIMFFLLATRRDSSRLISPPIIISLIFVPLTSLLNISLLIEYGLGPDPSSASQILMIGTSMCVLITNLMVFFLYDSLSKQAEKNLQMQIRLQQNDLLMRHNEEISGLYEEMRGWRHDYHNHLQVIHGYLQLKKYDKLKNYLEKIEENIDSMQLTINSGNSLIDAIVSSKILLARNQGIKIDTEIQVPSDLIINDTDMCVLLGNLLDNAIEACGRIADPDANRFIEINIKTIKGHLQITIKNSTNGKVKKIGSGFLTEKNVKHHGIGIKHIDEITEKYGGYINRNYENSIFETYIMFSIEKITCPEPSKSNCDNIYI